MIFKSIIYEDVNGQKKIMGLKDYIRDQIPSVRFWLMLKLRIGWNKQYNRYIAEVSKIVKENLTGENDKIREITTKEIIGKMEQGAWNTMPAPFLQALDIPRIQRF